VIKMNIDTDTQVGASDTRTSDTHRARAPRAHAHAQPHALRDTRALPADAPAAHQQLTRLPSPARGWLPLPSPPLARAAAASSSQWSYWDGIRSYEAEFHPYLQGQIGNPEGATKPNKKYYDPRMALRRGEEFTAARLGTAMEDLNSVNSCP
jgi:fructose/tagatose bisphosphate aldolase